MNSPIPKFQAFSSAHPGFTLIEIVTVLAIVAILVGFLAPLAFDSLQSSREDAVQQDLERIFKAIGGDPEQGNFGYLGDMGRLPDTLSELVEPGMQTLFHTEHGGTPHVGNVGTGWRGPYLTGKFATSDLFKDAWGQSLSFTSTGSTAGQIISQGPDATPNTSDDIKFPVQLPVLTTLTTGTIIIVAIVNDVPQPTGLTVDVFSTNSNGEQPSTPTVTMTTAGDGKPFLFTVPHGVSVVRATHTQSSVTVTRTVTIAVSAGTQVSHTIVMKTTATVQM